MCTTENLTQTKSPKKDAGDKPQYGWVRLSRQTWKLLRLESVERDIPMGKFVEQMVQEARRGQAAKRSA